MTDGGKSKRIPRNKRVADPPPMRLTERDRKIIKTVHDFRVMRGDQIQEMFFGSQSTASYRLLRLYQHGYLDRQFLPTLGGLASSPTLYTIGKQGKGVLRTAFSYGPEDIRRKLGKQQLSPLFLEHLLQINDIRVAVTLSAKENGYVLEQWLDDSQLKANHDKVTITTKAGTRKQVSLIPDSYFVLQVPQGRACFFLEVDRGTMTIRRFHEKLLAYEAYVASGEYQRRYGTRSLRVLVVVNSVNRLGILKPLIQMYVNQPTFYLAKFHSLLMGDVLRETVWTSSHQDDQAIIE